MADVFISYSRRNLDFVRRLDVALTTRGKSVWFDQKKEPLEGIPPGSKWWEEIQHGIRAADNFLFIISPASIASPYCNAEIAYALQREKRLVTALYVGEAGETTTLQAVDDAIDAIPEDCTLPASVSATITNLRALTRRNWLEVSQVQYVPFAANDTFEQSLELLIRGLDTDLAWLRTWSQVRQSAQIWAETKDDSYLWSELRLTPVREEVKRRKQVLLEVEREFLRPEVERLEEKLKDVALDHPTRARIGEQLLSIGDTRSGVGLRADGLPDMVWCEVPGGEVEIEGIRVAVKSFYIAQYPVTFMQFQAFLDDPDGFGNRAWWRELAAYHEKPGEQCYKFENHPRDNVNWYDAVAFCRWLNTKLPKEAWPQVDTQQTTVEIRLPTEWEWEQVATGGNPANEYPWGPVWGDKPRCNTYESGLQRTIAVGMYPQGASPVGALDMSGNVWEWCVNEYHNPGDISWSSTERRMLRGGSWYNFARYARCAARDAFNPLERGCYIGFRVVCGIPMP